MCAKQVFPHDLNRFFVTNGLIIEPEKLKIFYEEVIRGQEFNFERLVKLITSATRQPIIESTTIKVAGFS